MRIRAEPKVLGSTGVAGTCNAIWPSWTFPRAQAGASVTADKLKCELKPVTVSDYAVEFDASQLARLNAIFPAGVCDWSKSGVNQTSVVPSASFGPSPTNLVFDMSGL